MWTMDLQLYSLLFHDQMYKTKQKGRGLDHPPESTNNKQAINYSILYSLQSSTLQLIDYIRDQAWWSDGKSEIILHKKTIILP